MATIARKPSAPSPVAANIRAAASPAPRRASPAQPPAAPTAHVPPAARPGPPARPAAPNAVRADSRINTPGALDAPRPPAAPTPAATPPGAGVGKEILAALATLSGAVASLQKDVAALQKAKPAASAPAGDVFLSEEDILASADKAFQTLLADDWRLPYHGQGLTLKTWASDKAGELTANPKGGTLAVFASIPADSDAELDGQGRPLMRGTEARAAGLLAVRWMRNEDSDWGGIAFLSRDNVTALWAD